MSWMLKEIHQQPDVLEKMYRLENKNVENIARTARDRDPAFFMLVARGSSDNAALYGKYLFETILGIPAVLAAPSVVTTYGANLSLHRGVVIGISQSGESPDILAVMESARKSGAYTIAITNTRNSPLDKCADDTILLHAGLEKGLAATKTYTAQVLAMMMLAASFGQDKELENRIEKLPVIVAKTLDIEKEIVTICERYRYMQHCVIIGRGYNYSTVKEAALKFMETCYVVAQPFSTADFMHGPIAIAGAGFPTFVVVPKGKVTDQLHTMCKELRDKNLETIVISPIRKTLNIATIGIKTPGQAHETISPITSIIPFQFLACYLSAARGLDPDNPRFLRKITHTL